MIHEKIRIIILCCYSFQNYINICFCRFLLLFVFRVFLLFPWILIFQCYCVLNICATNCLNIFFFKNPQLYIVSDSAKKKKKFNCYKFIMSYCFFFIIIMQNSINWTKNINKVQIQAVVSGASVHCYTCIYVEFVLNSGYGVVSLWRELLSEFAEIRLLDIMIIL